MHIKLVNYKASKIEEEWSTYIDKAVVEEQAKNGGTHATFLSNSLIHGGPHNS